MNMFFPSAPDIASLGTKIVFVIVPMVLFQISQVIFMGALRGAGDTLFTAIISAFSVTVVRTAVSYLLAYTFSLGIVGVWLGMLSDQLFRFIVSSIRFKRGKWANIKI